MQTCRKCKTVFEGKFCPECGEKYVEEKMCPSCGAILSLGAKFCKECGQRLAEEPAPIPNEPQDAERLSKTPTPPPNEPQDAEMPPKELAPKREKVPAELRDAPAFVKYVYPRTGLIVFLILLVLSAAMFLFFLAPVAKMPLGDLGPFSDFGDETSTSYGSLYAMLSAPLTEEVFGACVALLVLTSLALVFSVVAVVLWSKPRYRRQITFIGTPVAVGFCFVFFLISCIMTGLLNAAGSMLGMIAAGSCPLLVLSFSLIAMLLSGTLYAGLFLVKKFLPKYEKEAREDFQEKLREAEERRGEKLRALMELEKPVKPQKPFKPVYRTAVPLNATLVYKANYYVKWKKFLLSAAMFCFCAAMVAFLCVMVYATPGYFNYHDGIGFEWLSCLICVIPLTAMFVCGFQKTERKRLLPVYNLHESRAAIAIAAITIVLGFGLAFLLTWNIYYAHRDFDGDLWEFIKASVFLTMWCTTLPVVVITLPPLIVASVFHRRSKKLIKALYGVPNPQKVPELAQFYAQDRELYLQNMAQYPEAKAEYRRRLQKYRACRRLI